MRTLVYVYAVLPIDAADDGNAVAAELPGIDDQPTRSIAESGLVAIVGDVAASEFDELPLNENVRNLDWLGRRAAEHQRVNADLFERTASALPLSFGVVFRDDDGVRDLLHRRAHEFRERLARVRDRSEWVVTVHRDRDRALASLDEASEALRELNETIEAAPPGRAYLLRRRIDDVRRQELLLVDAQTVRSVLDTLAAGAEAVHREPVADVASGPIIRASLLVARDGEHRLIESVEALRSRWQPRGYEVDLTGPWPPYRFGGLEQGVDDGAA